MPTCGKHWSQVSKWMARKTSWWGLRGLQRGSSEHCHHWVASQERRNERGGGGVGGCLTGSWSSGGWEVMLFLCPSQYRQEGEKRATRVPGIHRWALWSVIMGPIVPSCFSALYQRDKRAGFSVPVCPYISMCGPICVCVHLHSCAPIDNINSFGFV